MSESLGDRERELTEHNNRLASVLREARDQMIEINDAIKTNERLEAIGDALDYAILAVDMRVSECKAAIARGVVGQEADRAQGLSKFAIEDIFEKALRASGYEVVKCTEGQSSHDPR